MSFVRFAQFAKHYYPGDKYVDWISMDIIIEVSDKSGHLLTLSNSVCPQSRKRFKDLLSSN
jgi:hypothetical protein